VRQEKSEISGSCFGSGSGFGFVFGFGSGFGSCSGFGSGFDSKFVI